MEGNKKHNILNALFDVKPVNQRGDLDMDKISQIKEILDLRKGEHKSKPIETEQGRTVNLAIKAKLEPELFDPLPDNTEILPTKEEILAELEEFNNFDNLLEEVELVEKKQLGTGLEEFYFPEVVPTQGRDPDFTSGLNLSLKRKKPKSLFGFIGAGLLIALIIPTAAWLGQGLIVKEQVMSNSLSAYQNLIAAQQSLEESDWTTAQSDFSSAHSDFYQAHQEINKLGRLTLGILEGIPGSDLVSSGSHLVKVGENLAKAGQGLAGAINIFSYDNLFYLISSADNSLTDLMVSSQQELVQALAGIKIANQELAQVKVKVLPQDIQSGVVSLKEKLPLVEKMLVKAEEYSQALLKFLGHDNPRTYLLIFQNNSEARATGGFVGTYGLLTLDKGVISNLFVDGIFNADGQLHEKIIPPRPIQKVSTAWSMHDANWFADFPTSAQKIQWFYEKTGGPTTDGIISITPVLIERLLELTGPIAMPQYEIILDSNNFVEVIQYKVEIDYDKELNRPKKILADFTPLFIEKLGQLSSEEKKEAINIIFDCLEEKHIIFYFNNSSLENLMVNQGWSGQLLSTDKDYLSIVSSNINGFKTDRMVKETIEHQAEVQPDGSIIDTLTITREHQGGQEIYDWWNRVNSNYLRVYLPKGSQLISAQGQSLEIYQPPINYQEQNFKKDSLVSQIESGLIIDSKTGTQIFEENGKTVFGNWVYVSPGETVKLVYKYKLPFKIDLTKSTNSYSLIAQKQAGSLGSIFNHQLKFPSDWQVSWQHNMNYQGDLKTDKILGATFEF